MRWESEYQNEPFHSDDHYQQFAEEYVSKTAIFDRLVCTAEQDGVTVPANSAENVLVQRYAIELFRDIIAREHLDKEKLRSAILQEERKQS